MTNIENKLQQLKQILLSHAPLAIAFSGGVDSTFLLGYAHRVLGDQVIAVTANAPNFAPDEIAYAKSFCKSNGIRHIVVHLGDEILDSFAKNSPDRCYICKKAIFSNLQAQLDGMTLADGTNADDALDYRPGTKALQELGILNPLKDAGLTKLEIRQGLRFIPGGEQIWDKPAFACLASRIPYGEHITPEKLKAIYTVEKALQAYGFAQVRVRCHGKLDQNAASAIARIEVLPEDREKFFDTALMDKIDVIAREAGFAYVALDLAGYKMGNLNINL